MTALEYFKGNEMAADVWLNKYATKDEENPIDMHIRMAKELERIERGYGNNTKNRENWEKLSDFGKTMLPLKKDIIFSYFDMFKYIVPQGSIMTMLGNKYKIGSLSNCFVIDSPVDSYGGIMKTDEQLVQLMKRRGGVGMNLNTLRPNNTPVSNAAGTSTGAASFMHRYSNSTREVAQNGRRGALMLLMDCRHPDIFRFVNMKKDKTAVTGANISVMLIDNFMEAVRKDEDFICMFPFLREITSITWSTPNPEYNKLYRIALMGREDGYAMKIKAKELFDLIVENAWENAEPGIAFIDRILNYCPEGVYEQYKPIASNPCGEQWMEANDACRLLALNLFSIVLNPFTDKAKIDWDKLYEISYIQQRLADDIVDLEIEYVQRIIDKINSDGEPSDVKSVELNLWKEIKKVATASRRTGCGITALGDMLAALGIKYDSPKALKIIEKVMKKKIEAELDCTIDLAILRGTFEGWDVNKEYPEFGVRGEESYFYNSGNNFYEMLLQEFPEQSVKMQNYGRRNVSWSTVAPTGSVSILTETTSGLEPLFLPYYIRRKKINPNETGVRVDFTDQNGDCWQEYPILHPKFKEWMEVTHAIYGNIENASKSALDKLFEQSPWYKSCANDIDWEKRIELQAVIQKYTTNAISSTINLPSTVSKETVRDIYYKAWEKGLKGVTIYRDGCRTGVLISEKKTSFDYVDSTKRPKEVDGNLHIATVKGVKYAVVVGKIDNKPYELFAFKAEEDVIKIGELEGRIVKIKKGHYNFVNGKKDHTIKDLQIIAESGEEQILTRLVSGMLRHGARPQFCMEQIDKCDGEVVSFSRAISRILKKYVKEEELLLRNTCGNCNSTNLRMQEGCMTCLDCGNSRC